MDELDIGPGLVGQRVYNPARPEWGAGTVLRVETSRGDAGLQHRVSVQFLAGHKMVHIPPAKLTRELEGQTREAGWLDTVAGSTPDERLVRLPPEVTGFLGTASQRLALVAALYEYTDEPGSLITGLGGRRELPIRCRTGRATSSFRRSLSSAESGMRNCALRRRG